MIDAPLTAAPDDPLSTTALSTPALSTPALSTPALSTPALSTRWGTFSPTLARLTRWAAVVGAAHRAGVPF